MGDIFKDLPPSPKLTDWMNKHRDCKKRLMEATDDGKGGVRGTYCVNHGETFIFDESVTS